MSKRLPAPKAPRYQVMASQKARAAMQQIKALRGAATVFAQMMEAQVMEQLEVIRREFGEAHERDFLAYIKEELGWKADATQKRIAVWRAVRQNRAVRELAQQQPHEAFGVIGEMVQAEIAIEPEDQEVARILTMPAARRRKEMRLLLDRASGKAVGRHPGDQEEIRRLKQERDAALEEARGAGGRPDVKALVKEFYLRSADIVACAEQLAALPPGELPNLLQATENAIAAGEWLSGELLKLMGESEAGADDG